MATQYNAFISYSHKNRLWAKWLKYRLETFSSHKFSNEKHPIKEVFLDSYNLSVGDLKEKVLPENLHNSKYLICLCTKHYNSEWVEYEIEEFKRACIKRGDDWKDHIIPLCIGCKEDFLPENIRGIKAATINGWTNFLQQEYAVSLIVAKILGIGDPDHVYGHFRRILYLKSLIASIFVLAALAYSFYLWEFNRTKYLYFHDYIEGRYIQGQDTEWLEGIGELSKSEVDTLKEYFRFEYKRIPLGEPKAGKWQLRRVAHLNVFASPVDFEERTTPFKRHPIMDIKYSYRDSVYMPEHIECYNENNILQRIIQISGESLDKLDFKDFKTDLSFNEQTLADFADPLLNMLGNKYCNITHFDMTRGNDGLVNGIVFKSNNGIRSLPMPDTRRHIAITLARDSIGRIVAVAYWTYNNECIYDVCYNYNGYVFSGKCLRRKQQPIVLVDYKDKGNVVEKNIWHVGDSALNRIKYQFKDGILQQKRKIKFLRKGTNTSFIEEKVTYSYNSLGLVICESHLGRHDETNYSKHYQYNADNLVSRVEYTLSSNNINPPVVIGPEGYTSCENQYKDGLLILQKFYKGNDVYYYIYYKYDNNNRLISMSYCNSKNVIDNCGVFSKTIPCDEYEKSCLTAIEGLLDARNRGSDMYVGDTIFKLRWKFPFWNKYARREFVYDDLGNIEKIRYYNKDEVCYVIIDEDILEDGTVPLSQGYIINPRGQKLPLTFNFRPIRGGEQIFEDPLTMMLVENMLLDDE